MKKSKVCHANLTFGDRFSPMLTDAECDELEELDNPRLIVFTACGKRRHFANRAPCIRLPGPVINFIRF